MLNSFKQMTPLFKGIHDAHNFFIMNFIINLQKKKYIWKWKLRGWKSNVVMNVWLPQIGYPCSNFSDTLSFKFWKIKRSIRHVFTICICTENQNQMSFYPFVPHNIFFFIEFILRHLCYLLTDVSPQPNFAPYNVFHLDQRPQRGDLRLEARVW